MYTVYIYITHIYIYTRLSHIYIYYTYLYITHIISTIMPHLLCSHRIVGMAVDGGYRWQTKQYGTSCPAEVPPGLSSSLLFKLWRLQGPWQSSKKAKNPMSKMIAKCTLSISEQSVWALASGCKCLVVLLLLGIVGLIWRQNFFSFLLHIPLSQIGPLAGLH